MSSPSHRIRITSLNCWHGLDHTRPLLMFPVEKFRLARKRQKAIRRVLKEQILSPLPGSQVLQLFSLQELNPISRVVPALSQELKLWSHALAVNTGARVGRLSYPLFLEEGLGNFVSKNVSEFTESHIFLSGKGWDTQWASIPLSFHLAERRGALLSTFKWEGHSYGLINLHLHSGPPALASARRSEEIHKLLEWVELKAKDIENLFIAGDFNSRASDPEMKLLQDAGFKHLAPAGGQHSWDPDKNNLCLMSAELDRIETWRKWDFEAKSIDHIFLRQKDRSKDWKAESRLIGDTAPDGVFISDHFGITLDLSW